MICDYILFEENILFLNILLLKARKCSNIALKALLPTCPTQAGMDWLSMPADEWLPHKYYLIIAKKIVEFCGKKK